jgi:hypothetical protein
MDSTALLLVIGGIVGFVVVVGLLDWLSERQRSRKHDRRQSA